MKTSFGSNSNDIAQSRVIEHHLRENPIYARSTVHEPPPTHVDHCNSLRRQHQPHHQHQRHHAGSSSAAATHSYEKLDHVVINPTSSSTNPAYNLLTVATPTAAVTSPDVVNTMGYLVANPTACDQLARPIIIWAPRSRDANNTAELNVVTDQHGRQCCCTSASGLPSTATTSGGGYMECDTRTRNNVIGGEDSRDRLHVTEGAESRDTGVHHDSHQWLSRDQNTNYRCGRSTARGPYTSMSHRHDRLNDWNISAL